ncbi:MAG TPA: type II toxin-antitoxin system HicA family toxin [Flavobacteriales bacterium]|nr:type II toxin-antitoxin system HicA family toxin [Flavobacteriales bacterium]
MAKQVVLTAKEAERLLLKAGFEWVRTAGGHRIYMKGNVRMVLPFHAGKSLHPKIVKQVLEVVEAN